MQKKWAAATAAAARGITMAEPDVYLEKLSAFSRMLHLENLSVSPKETEDAARLLIALGMDLSLIQSPSPRDSTSSRMPSSA